jgi:hypothetical protein
MFTGALLGALLVTNIDLVLPLSIAVALIAASALAAHWLSAEGSDCAQPAGRADSSPSHPVLAAGPGS